MWSDLWLRTCRRRSATPVKIAEMCDARHAAWATTIGSCRLILSRQIRDAAPTDEYFEKVLNDGFDAASLDTVWEPMLAADGKLRYSLDDYQKASK